MLAPRLNDYLLTLERYPCLGHLAYTTSALPHSRVFLYIRILHHASLIAVFKKQIQREKIGGF